MTLLMVNPWAFQCSARTFAVGVRKTDGLVVNDRGGSRNEPFAPTVEHEAKRVLLMSFSQGRQTALETQAVGIPLAAMASLTRSTVWARSSVMVF